ncbi:MAG: neutral/alkaline non-lysosomal ceramidase N-terminal domain-containing protein [Victivallaceae bacterium]|nr:neutral/alkaline non-lysosomal ceramidase N-terminal domain-containing protein [Victivallaceae bacterium]
MNNKLLIGWGEADITPDGRIVELSGQCYQRIAKEIHSRLKTVAMLLEQNKKITLMISLDVVGLPDDFCLDIQKTIAGKFSEISGDNIIINAIHTHSAPGLNRSRNWWTHNPEAISAEEYRELVTRRILEAVKQAMNSRQISGISNAVSFASVGHCRRAVYSNKTAEMYGVTNRDDFLGMEGGEDSGVDLLFSFDESGKATGAVVNIPCPSQIMEATYKISSDYMGKLRTLLKEHFGNEFYTLCQIAPAGCQSPRDLTRPETNAPFWREAGVEVIATRIFDSIQQVYEKLATNIKYSAKLEHSMEVIELPRRRASYQDYQNAQKTMRELEEKQSSSDAYRDFCAQTHNNENIPDRPGPYDSKLHHFVKIRNEEAVIKRFEEQNDQPSFKMQLQVVKLGNVVFVSNPFELYLEYGHRIRARSRAEQTFMIQICNGYCGYLPSERAEELGGYGGLIINGQIGSDGGKMLVDQSIMKIEKIMGIVL